MGSFLRILAVLFTAVLGSGSARAESDSAALQRLEATWNEAHLEGDTAALQRLWSDDLTILVPRMDPMSKQEALAFWARVPITFSRYESTVLSSRILGATAITTGKVMRARSFGGKAMEDTWLFTKVYAKQGGVWKVVAYHASEAPTPEPQQ